LRRIIQRQAFEEDIKIKPFARIDWRDWRWVVAAHAVSGFFAFVRALGRMEPGGLEDFFRDLKHFVDSLLGL
jgi:hypothetical protein